jgi:hypothetical protein
MRKELNADTEMFETLDRDIDAASGPLRASLSIKEAMLEEYTRKFIERAERGEPVDHPSVVAAIDREM